MKEIKLGQLPTYLQVTGSHLSTKQNTHAHVDSAKRSSEAQLASLVALIKRASTEEYHQTKLQRIQQQIENNQYPLDMEECVAQFVLGAMIEDSNE